MATLDLKGKLAILADAAKYDASCASSGADRSATRKPASGIGSTEGIGHLPLLCARRPLHLAAQDPADQFLRLRLRLLRQPPLQQRPRAPASRPRRWSTLTLDFYRRNYIEGLFLSSGIIRSPDYTMEQLVRVARMLREEHGFRGYIHLKTIPDAAPELIAAGRALRRPAVDQHRAADRASPRAARAGEGRSRRSARRWAHLRLQHRATPPAAKGEPERRRASRRPGRHADDRRRRRRATTRDILATSDRLYAGYGLKRVYYSAFCPIPDASSAGCRCRAPPLMREHRLYQADWLMRFYGFEARRDRAGAERRHARPRDRPQARLGAAQPRAFPGRRQHAPPRRCCCGCRAWACATVDRILSIRAAQGALRLDDLAGCAASVTRCGRSSSRPTGDPGGARPSTRARLRRSLRPPPLQLALFPACSAVELAHPGRLRTAWREAARRLLAGRRAARGVRLGGEVERGRRCSPRPGRPLPATAAGRASASPRALRGARRRSVVCHRDPARFALLYRLLWRLQGERRRCSRSRPTRMSTGLERMARAVRRDIHKMHAFVRFRRSGAARRPGMLALVRARPLHRRAGGAVLRAALRRHGLVDPDARPQRRTGTARAASMAPGASRRDVPDDDALEEHWRSLLRQHLQPGAAEGRTPCSAEMPQKYLAQPAREPADRSADRARPAGAGEEWSTAATDAVARGHRSATPRVEACRTRPSRHARGPARAALQACRRCGALPGARPRRCPGEGPRRRRLMLVGEQPGDQEDLAGPAVRRARRATCSTARWRRPASTAPACYVTNAVKHFKFEPRGKRRIHQSPDAGEIEPCRWWLDRSAISAVRPRLIVALGATAGRSLLRRPVAAMRERGAAAADDGER